VEKESLLLKAVIIFHAFNSKNVYLQFLKAKHSEVISKWPAFTELQNFVDLNFFCEK